MNDEDFYEEDEPVEDIIAAFDRGEKGLTAPPRSVIGYGWGPVVTWPTTKSSGNVKVTWKTP